MPWWTPAYTRSIRCSASSAVSETARCFPALARVGSAPRGNRMDEKLQEIEQRFERLTADLGNPAVIGDRSRFSQIAKERAQLEPLVEAFREYQRAKRELDETLAELDAP